MTSATTSTRNLWPYGEAGKPYVDYVTSRRLLFSTTLINTPHKLKQSKLN
jgi:hypothetical protein